MAVPRVLGIEAAFLGAPSGTFLDDASRNSLRSASGSTTVPISRPAITIRPVAARARWRSSRAARSSGRPKRRIRRHRPAGCGLRPSGRRRRRGRTTAGPLRQRRARPRWRGLAGAAGSVAGHLARATARSRPCRAGPCRRSGTQPAARPPRPTLLLPDDPGPSSATTRRVGSGADDRGECTPSG